MSHDPERALPVTAAWQRVHNLRCDIAAEQERQTAAMTKLQSELAEAGKAAALTGDGVDPERVARARAVLSVKGSPVNSKRMAVVRDALDDLASGGHRLAQRQMGTKDYAAWSDQREDHNYGYGPKHGSMVFQIGLANPKELLTPEQTEDALGFLMNLQRVMDLESQAVRT
jgi:hypothetical protein